VAQVWSVYILGCSDGTYYTGITTDVERRFQEHQSGGIKAARYCKGRGPLQLLFNTPIGSHSRALKFENAIKKLSKKRKTLLINNHELLSSFFQDL